LKLNEQGFERSAYYYGLGTFYYKVPGCLWVWDRGQTAEKIIKKCVEINPQGIASLIIFCLFLLEKKHI